MKILIHKTRKEKNITLEELEILTGISKTTLSSIENEKTSPRMHQLEAIAIALNVKVTDLFESEYK